MSLLLTVSQNPSCYAVEQGSATAKPENVQHAVDSRLHNMFSNDVSSLNTSMHAVVEMSAHANRIASPSSMRSAQSSSMGLIQVINGGMIKSEPGYSGSPSYIFGPDSTVLDACPTIGDGTVTSFTSVNSNSHSMNGALLDLDISSFGVLGQISRNLSLSDLTADFSQSSGMFSLLFIIAFYILACLMVMCKRMVPYSLMIHGDCLKFVPSFFFLISNELYI